MAFAKDYSAEITLAYYCTNVALVILLFLIGTIYLKQRDRRDEQRREWRQFAEKIYSEYSELKTKDIPRKISKVKNTFEKIRMTTTITGLDVLRYMLAEGNYERSKTTQLERLREDLQSIFPLFNICSSLLLLGNVPKNIKEELKDVISDQGKMVLPFFKGMQRKIILNCLEHFSNDRPKSETERTTKDLDSRLEESIPYVKICLKFGTSEGSLPGPFDLAGFHHDGRATVGLENIHDYSECSNFSLYINGDSPQVRDLISLQKLHNDLEDRRYLTGFVRELRKEQPASRLDLIEQISHLDTDECVVVKALHEVRVYIYWLLNGNQYRAEIEANMERRLKRLLKVQEEVTKLRPTEAIVKGICERLIKDLQRFQTSEYYCKSEDFCEKLQQFWNKLQDIQIIREPPATTQQCETQV